MPRERIVGGLTQSDVKTLTQSNVGRRRSIEIHDSGTLPGLIGYVRDEGKSPGAVSIAAVDMDTALILAFVAESLQRSVFGDIGTVALHGREECIIQCVLHAVGILRIVGHFEQTVAELHPGEGDAGFHHVEGWARLESLASVPTFLAGAGPGNIDFLGYDMAERSLGNMEIVAVACELP